MEQTEATAAAPARPEARKLTQRESLYVSGNRKRDNIAPPAEPKDPRPRSRLYARRDA